MERKHTREKHEHDGHHRPRASWHVDIQCQLDARDDVRHLRTSNLKDGSARPLHVIGALFVTDHLQCEVCLNACTYVRSPSFEQRPAAFDPLSAAKIPGDLPFKLMVRRLAKIMNQ